MMPQTLILIRGIPGSGKTTLAESLSKALNFCHYEADQYFLSGRGEYIFESRYLKLAHRRCFLNTKEALEAGYSVIVSNTFTRKWEMEPYRNLAASLDIQVSVLICNNEFQNIHGVPAKKVQQMKERFEL